LAEALSQGGDYADLYFEYLLTSSIGIDESMVKSAAQGVSMGVGVRVISGERTGYAYSDDLSPERIRKAARVAACIAAGPSKVEKGRSQRRRPSQSVSRAHRAHRDRLRGSR
jgi:TldD protein